MQSNFVNALHATILFKQCLCNYFHIYFFYFRKLTGYEESKSKKQTLIKNDETVTAIEQTNVEDNENTNEQDQEEHIEGKLLIIHFLSGKCQF